MYIVTDNDNVITNIVLVGGYPESEGTVFEVDETDIPEEVLKCSSKYKYIDGNFIGNDDYDSKRLEDFKNKIIPILRARCGEEIISGIDYMDKHYSLEYADQINLLRSAANARAEPSGTIMYHADGEEDMEYTAEEIIGLNDAVSDFIRQKREDFKKMRQLVLEAKSPEEIKALGYDMER